MKISVFSARMDWDLDSHRENAIASVPSTPLLHLILLHSPFQSSHRPKSPQYPTTMSNSPPLSLSAIYTGPKVPSTQLLCRVLLHSPFQPLYRPKRPKCTSPNLLRNFPVIFILPIRLCFSAFPPGRVLNIGLQEYSISLEILMRFTQVKLA